MNLWKTIHRKLIDEPIERLVGWPSFASGSLSEKNTSDGPASGNGTASDEWRSTAEDMATNRYGSGFWWWPTANQIGDDDGFWPK
ncbi:MAG: hypothetical protein IPJ48_16810 [Propionivibrio sp.]|uniref:Uncharacterized protein n=1 Tax=Candidatus Propionivibrio dominans TaxID=2954373 RepID=A0A9D7I8R3_9RHOO|nr:hypothetical protein [Candidatus Propionivibrio dominans]